ncbi:MAG TPA: [LysW]-aminoadipate kinase [Longimicrobiales bacterium]|nr:[LysW]-aminoadipate kinase [Longimicrobiales bacterium]
MLIVKIGGGEGLDLGGVVDDLAGVGRPFILLHGANHLRDEMARALGRPSKVVESISGFSSVLSDDDAVDVLLASYAGIRNKRLVELLRKAGVNAIGLTGLDGGLVQGMRNQGIRVMQDGRKLLLRDNSGKPKAVNGALLKSLMADGYTPVLTVPIAGEDGSALNTENDEVLALLAAEVGATEVVSLIEAPGLLADRGDDASVVRELDAADLPGWEERVGGRMKRKIRALRSLFAACPGMGVRVTLADGRLDRPVSRALAGQGTVILARAAVGSGDEGPKRVVVGASRSWLDRQAPVELDVYGKRGLALVWGEGARVRDAEGREYIDCVAGHGALNLGHRHPRLAEALRVQSEALWFCPGSYANPARATFLEKLVAALPPELDRAFLCNSGTESVEAGLKIARAVTRRAAFVAAVRGFHGRTMGALSVTAEARYREPFEPLLGDVRRVPFNKGEAFIDTVDESVAAVVLEPVQGEGGVHQADPAFLKAAREACDRAGALLIFDEVQTGFGRTGSLFAFERSGVLPDVLCLAKSIAGGLPLGATVVRTGIDLPAGAHGSTFGGNPLACAVGSATLDVLTEGTLVEDANRKGARLADRVREAELDVVREVRQVGLMIGIQLKAPVRPYLAALQDAGVLALAAGTTVLRLLPPLVISDEQVTQVAEAVVRVLAGAIALEPAGA